MPAVIAERYGLLPEDAEAWCVAINQLMHKVVAFFPCWGHFLVWKTVF